MKFLLSVVFASTIFLLPSNSQAAPASCTRVVDVSSRAAGALIQWKNGQVQRASSALTSRIVGFLRNPTIIATQGRNPFTLGSATILNSAGQTICSSGPRLGCASNRGECLARYKFNCSTTSVRQRTTGGAFVRVASGLCIRIPNAGRCYNVKVRDLCDGRTL
jgi:hypothetical protein